MIEEYNAKRMELETKFAEEQKQIDEGKPFDSTKWIPNKEKLNQANVKKGTT